MRKDIQDFLYSKQDLHKFVREQPIWYRKLTRNPSSTQSLEFAAMNYYKKTIPHKIEKFNDSLEMASMMFHVFQAMNSKD